MTDTAIRFDDGAAYEQYMSPWSRLAGQQFLDWLQPASSQRWLDIGCGNGAFTELLLKTCAPAHVQGIDPSPAQIEYARERFAASAMALTVGDAMALPQADLSVDVAVMALVIFFVPEPARGVAEMARVVRPGGVACAYAWDVAGGHFPWAAMHAGMRAVGMEPAQLPSAQAADIAVMTQLWRDAGFDAVQTCTLEVQRRFASFDEYWQIGLRGPSMVNTFANQDPAQMRSLKEAVHAQFDGVQGAFTVNARANAVQGRKPD